MTDHAKPLTEGQSTIRRAELAAIIYRYHGPDADIRHRLGLTIGDWTITSNAAHAAAHLLRQRVAGMAVTNAQIVQAVIGAGSLAPATPHARHEQEHGMSHLPPPPVVGHAGYFDHKVVVWDTREVKTDRVFRLYCVACIARFELATDDDTRPIRADEPPHNSDLCDGCGQPLHAATQKLAGHAATLDTIDKLAEQAHGSRVGEADLTNQRYVPLLAVRQACGLAEHVFDRAVGELAAEHRVWLRVNWQSTADDDRASVRRNGTDYHRITADPWR